MLPLRDGTEQVAYCWRCVLWFLNRSTACVSKAVKWKTSYIINTLRRYFKQFISRNEKVREITLSRNNQYFPKNLAVWTQTYVVMKRSLYQSVNKSKHEYIVYSAFQAPKNYINKNEPLRWMNMLPICYRVKLGPVNSKPVERNPIELTPWIHSMNWGLSIYLTLI